MKTKSKTSPIVPNCVGTGPKQSNQSYLMSTATNNGKRNKLKRDTQRGKSSNSRTPSTLYHSSAFHLAVIANIHSTFGSEIAASQPNYTSHLCPWILFWYWNISDPLLSLFLVFISVFILLIGDNKTTQVFYLFHSNHCVIICQDITLCGIIPYYINFIWLILFTN